jgi:hypothetical protein
MKKRYTTLVAAIILATRCLSQVVPTVEKYYLSGKGSDDTSTWDFFCTGGRNSGYWTHIQVPSCWEQQGFGSYNYGRDYKTYGKNFRFADEKGLYRYRFTVPERWKNKDVYIVFEGSMTDTEVKINGKSAGEVHRGAFYRFRYPVAALLEFGKTNLLEVTVSKLSADASVNNAERLADYWVFGGIYRPVYLEAYPEQHIEQLAIDAKANGHFAMQVQLQGVQGRARLLTEIYDQQGKKQAAVTTVVHAADTLALVQAQLQQPALWTAETPHLYKARVSLQQQGRTVYQATQSFGFRTIEIRKGEGIYLNGVQVKMKGTNRHCFWPETGRTLNNKIQLMDVQLLKEMNMNAVRCSHYPPDQYFLDLCDSLGLYVLDELAGWQKWYSTAAGTPLVKEMVQRDRNHPSVIFWDNGNEGGTNKALDTVFGIYDFSHRPVIHPHHRPGNAFNGIDCNHYEDYYSTKNILADSNIYMPTEFLHSQDDGGAGAALNDFWELHWHAKKSGGGFIWAMLDEAVARTDFNGQLDANGVNAPDGILGPHREKEGSFYAIREVFSPLRIFTQTLPAGFNGELPLENRYHFTNTRDCKFRWQLVRFNKPGYLFAGSVTMAEGAIASPDIQPGAQGRLQWTLPSGWQQNDALLVSASDPSGREIYRWSWRIRSNEQLLDSVVQVSNEAAIQTNETDSLLQLTAGGITVVFNKLDGSLQQVKNNSGDRLSFGKGPVMAGGNAGFAWLKHYREKDGYAVEVLYNGSLQYAKWKMYATGWLELEYKYHLEGEYPFMGISFTYPENYVLGARWLGKGPYRVWKNRLQGVTDDVWENPYNNTQTGAAPWLYPEFKGYYADVVWMELNTVEGKFIVASKTPGLYVRLFDFYGLSGVQPFPALPPGNLSFLDGIPPIGTKLALNIDTHTARLGPASELNKARGDYSRTLYFYFGSVPVKAGKQQYNAPVKDELF